MNKSQLPFYLIVAYSVLKKKMVRKMKMEHEEKKNFPKKGEIVYFTHI